MEDISKVENIIIAIIVIMFFPFKKSTTVDANSNKPSNIEHKCTVQYNTFSAIFENE